MTEPVNAIPLWGSKDRPRKAEAIWQTLVHHCGPAIARGRWVDIGCGSGGIAAHLAPRVNEMIGLDPEPWPQWREWTEAHANLQFLRGGYDAEPQLVPPNSADVIICNQVYEHVADPVMLIRFIHRTLKPGGYCYFAGPNLLFPVEPHVYWPFIHWLPRAWAVSLMRAVGAKYLIDANSTTYWRLQRWLGEFGLVNALPFILRHPGKMERHAWYWRVMARCPYRLIDWLTPLSPTLVFVARKRNAVHGLVNT